jgi:hypothetical protein
MIPPDRPNLPHQPEARTAARGLAQWPPTRRSNLVAAGLGVAYSRGTRVRAWANGPRGPGSARAHNARSHRRLFAAEEPVVEGQRPVVTELALPDALNRFVNLIEGLNVDADFRVEVTTDGNRWAPLSLPALQVWAPPCRRRRTAFPDRRYARPGLRPARLRDRIGLRWPSDWRNTVPVNQYSQSWQLAMVC